MNKTAVAGFNGDNAAAIQAMLNAVKLVGVEEGPAKRPAGELGGCTACQHTVRSHFDPSGQWVGCQGVEPGTVFVLMPVPAKIRPVKPRYTGPERRQVTNGGLRADTSHDMATQVQEATPDIPAPFRQGPAGRFRYRSALHHKAKPGKLELSPTRVKVLETIHASGKAGLIARDIMKKAHLPHGSVQQTVNWLRNHKFVDAEVDATE